MTRWIFISLLVAGIVGAVMWKNKAADAMLKTGPDANAPVTVMTVKVVSRDVPLWLTGIGTVQGYNTVVIRPRVGGILEKIEFTEGSMVKKGDIIAQIDPRPYQASLDLATAKKAQNEALLVSAKQDRKRMEVLVKSQSVSEQALEQASARVAELEAAIQADSASIASAQLELDYATVRAPLSGRTGIRHVDEGNLVTANQTEGIVHITQMQPIAVQFTLPQKYLSILHGSMALGATPLKVEALDEQSTPLGEGTLELIDNQIDLSTGTLRLKARFANENLKLWPGQFVSARILVQTRKGATVVPIEVIRPGLDGSFAYVVGKDDVVEARYLEVGPNVDGWTVVEKGLKAGDEVVREGQVKLKPGVKIKRLDPSNRGKTHPDTAFQ